MASLTSLLGAEQYMQNRFFLKFSQAVVVALLLLLSSIVLISCFRSLPYCFFFAQNFQFFMVMLANFVKAPSVSEWWRVRLYQQQQHWRSIGSFFINLLHRLKKNSIYQLQIEQHFEFDLDQILIFQHLSVLKHFTLVFFLSRVQLIFYSDFPFSIYHLRRRNFCSSRWGFDIPSLELILKY